MESLFIQTIYPYGFVVQGHIWVTSLLQINRCFLEKVSRLVWLTSRRIDSPVLTQTFSELG